MADDYPTRSEFNAVTGSLQKQIDAQTRSYENLTRDTKDEIRRLTESVNKKDAPAADHGALAMMRIAEAVEKRLTAPTVAAVAKSGHWWVGPGFGALVMLVVFLSWKAFVK